MPIYEYRCDKGHEVDVIQSMSEDALTECPECGAPTRRVLHSPAIHFKGSGFHNTDYGTRSGNKQKQAAAAAKKESSPDSSSSETSSPSDTSSSTSSDKKSESPAKSTAKPD
ncbi:MAG: FmdB family transcriptional regulator [Thermoleophilia bacterium]|nr:FmdB family transcriptional regulator [Thermoleophilia bacterium]